MESQTVMRRVRSSSNDAGSLLASTFVVALGIGCTLFMMLAMSPESMSPALTTAGIVAGGVLLMIIRVRFRITGKKALSFWSVLSRSYRDDGLACQYQPRKAATGKSTDSADRRQPLSVEELREIQTTSANAWVPSRGRHGGRVG